VDVALDGPITRRIGGPAGAKYPDVIKAVTMAHAWLHNCVFAKMVGSGRIVALLPVRPHALSKAHVPVPTIAAVELDSWDEPASRLHAEQAVSTVHASVR